MSLYMIISSGLRLYVAVIPQQKRIVSREEAAKIWNTMQSHRGAV